MDISEIGNSIHRHPWELSRADMLLEQIRLHKNINYILDIGCGDGFFTEKILELDNIKEIIGIDTAISSINILKSEKIKFFKNTNEIGNRKFDMILFLDVLEHIEKDSDFLSYFSKHLKDDGKIIIITVPAHQRLFSAHDIALKHYRRYNRTKLLNCIEKAGFKATTINEFYTSLVIPRLLTQNRSIGISNWSLPETHYFTRFIRLILNIDFMFCCWLNKFGIYLKGLSIFAIIEKA